MVDTGDARSLLFKNRIEAHLAAGFWPFRQRPLRGGRGSAVAAAAISLGVPRSTLTDWVERQELAKTQYRPKWSLYSVDKEIAPDIPIPASDPIRERRLQDELAATKAALRAAERRAAGAEDIRSGLLGLAKDPIRPHIQLPTKNDGQPSRQAIILHVSDLHVGEVISSREILGSNKYDLATFRARCGRLFSSAAELAIDHWPVDDDPPEEIVVCLGGDLISGSIHPELAETNAGTDYELFRVAAEHIAGGLSHLRNETGLPLRVLSVPGNHGRQTIKPQHKRQGLQSWDILVTDFAEAALRGDNGITWYRSEGTDCYFDVVGWPILLTHGHAMGAGSGEGFIGPAAPIIRGHQKIYSTEMRQRRPVYMVLSAHYHTTIKTPWGWSNGSLVGYNEFVRSHRGEPEPAMQNMFVMHERMGLIRWHPIYVGDPSEGTLYQGSAAWRAPMHLAEGASHAQEILPEEARTLMAA